MVVWSPHRFGTCTSVIIMWRRVASINPFFFISRVAYHSAYEVRKVGYSFILAPVKTLSVQLKIQLFYIAAVQFSNSQCVHTTEVCDERTSVSVQESQVSIKNIDGKRIIRRIIEIEPLDNLPHFVPADVELAWREFFPRDSCTHFGGYIQMYLLCY